MKLAGHNIPVHWSQSDADHMRRIRPKSIKLIDFHPGRTRAMVSINAEINRLMDTLRKERQAQR